jgi:peptidyl-prolyl cis-trans isomerase C
LGAAMNQLYLEALAADTESSRPAPRKSVLKTILHDPLLHFVLMGGLLFIAGWEWQRAHNPRRINVDPYTIDHIAVGYRQRFGAPPSPQALKLAVGEYVTDEVLYREGVAQGIDRDDEIVRRRIIQKMRFLQEDRTLPEQPSEAAIRAYYDAHRNHYVTAARASFSHIYFAQDSGEASARKRAAQARALLAGGKSPTELGDPFPDRSVFSNLSEEDAERVFGKSAFSHALFELVPGQWSAPLASGFGIHLVRVDHRDPPSIAPFESVRAQVATDLSERLKDRANHTALQALQARYIVVLPKVAAAR